MSSVAVLTQESFAEHRSGLVPQQIKGNSPLHLFLLTLRHSSSKSLSDLVAFLEVPFGPVVVGSGQDLPVLRALFCTTLVCRVELVRSDGQIWMQ